jgi:hypothetical protein
MLAPEKATANWSGFRSQGGILRNIPGNLLERLRHDVSTGIIKVDKFRIANGMQSVYVRVVLMLDPSLCGFFQLQRHTDADALVINGCTWSGFASVHGAELWPGRSPNGKDANIVKPELPVSEAA